MNFATMIQDAFREHHAWAEGDSHPQNQGKVRHYWKIPRFCPFVLYSTIMVDFLRCLVIKDLTNGAAKFANGLVYTKAICAPPRPVASREVSQEIHRVPGRHQDYVLQLFIM